MLVLTEQLAVLLQGEDVGVGIDTGLVDLVQRHQLVAHLVGGVGQHQHHLLAAHGDTAQADGEAVAGEDGEDHTDSLTAQLGADVVSDVLHRAVVALSAGHDGLGHGDDVAVTKLKALGLGGLQDALGDDGGQIVALADDGAANTPGYGTDFSCLFHNVYLLKKIYRVGWGGIQAAVIRLCTARRSAAACRSSPPRGSHRGSRHG